MWCARRGAAGTRIFLCVWHVKRAWLKNLRTKVKDYTHRKQLLNAVSEVLEERDLSKAKPALTALLKEWVRALRV